MRKWMLRISAFLFFASLGLSLGDLVARDYRSFVNNALMAATNVVIWLTWLRPD
jgi:hypothetical protein